MIDEYDKKYGHIKGHFVLCCDECEQKVIEAYKKELLDEIEELDGCYNCTTKNEIKQLIKNS